MLINKESHQREAFTEWPIRSYSASLKTKPAICSKGIKVPLAVTDHIYLRYRYHAPVPTELFEKRVKG